MKPIHFDILEYIMDEIWNIATNPLRNCGFAPDIQYMIEMVTKDKFYKDSRHDPLHHVVPKDPRTSHASASAYAAPCTAHNGGASSASSTNSGFLKMFIGIFAMCHRMNQHLDVMEQCLQSVRCNQEIIHCQQDEPFLEFPKVPVFPPVPDHYALLTPAELATFSIGPAHVLMMMRRRRSRLATMSRWRMMSSRHCIFASQLISLFGVLTTKGEKRVIFISVFHSSVCGL
jgi:hypothetical protein